MSHTTHTKALVGVLLIINLTLMPLYRAAYAYSQEPPLQDYPATSEDWEKAVASIEAGYDPTLVIEPQDAFYREVSSFHITAFETVFGRQYVGEDAAYLFDQPLDESTYSTSVPGHNSAGDACSALVLYAQPIDVSSVLPENGVTTISSALVGGTLDGVGSQAFWGISLVYDFSDGNRYNDLFLLTAMESSTVQALLITAGLVEYNGPVDCVGQCDIDLATCMRNAEIDNLLCNVNGLIFYAKCLAACAIGSLLPGIGAAIGLLCFFGCTANWGFDILSCFAANEAAIAICLSNYVGCMEGCGIIIAYE